eukprot:gene419-70_t
MTNMDSPSSGPPRQSTVRSPTGKRVTLKSQDGRVDLGTICTDFCKKFDWKDLGVNVTEYGMSIDTKRFRSRKLAPPHPSEEMMRDLWADACHQLATPAEFAKSFAPFGSAVAS